MLIKFRDNTFLEKPVGSKLVGLKRAGARPTSVEFDYYDMHKLLQSPNLHGYLLHLWRALAPQKDVTYLIEEKKNNANT